MEREKAITLDSSWASGNCLSTSLVKSFEAFKIVPSDILAVWYTV
jgi:hypothetical protein